MKTYLLDFFNYNNWASEKFIEVIQTLPEKEESLKLFSHLIAAQDKWANRITKKEEDSHFAWSGKVFSAEELGGEWKRSFLFWKDLLENNTDEYLETDVIFYRASDKKGMKLKVREIIFQLNCHAIHHRAQIATLMSKQGVAPPAADYVFSVLKEA
jgi:uncharacterized damage-inducible protein DinB